MPRERCSRNCIEKFQNPELAKKVLDLNSCVKDRSLREQNVAIMAMVKELKASSRAVIVFDFEISEIAADDCM